jgi:hypothetical protein
VEQEDTVGNAGMLPRSCRLEPTTRERQTHTNVGAHTDSQLWSPTRVSAPLLPFADARAGPAPRGALG